VSPRKLQDKRIDLLILLRKTRGFSGGVAEDSVILGYDAASMGDLIPTFRENVLLSTSRVHNS
jgi:hypothetical protein